MSNQGLDVAKEKLIKVMAEEMAVERSVMTLQAELNEHRGYEAQAREQGQVGLAEEISERIVDLEEELTAQQKLWDDYRHDIAVLQQHIRETERQPELDKADQAARFAASLDSGPAGQPEFEMQAAKNAILERLKAKRPPA
ncbi:MAG: hypothetical protein GY862_15290 [Gammaproteobacteria bacterium]|nr:hypothetical protein [Gammaproteobacteria bacterium]